MYRIHDLHVQNAQKEVKTSGRSAPRLMLDPAEFRHIKVKSRKGKMSGEPEAKKDQEERRKKIYIFLNFIIDFYFQLCYFMAVRERKTNKTKGV